MNKNARDEIMRRAADILGTPEPLAGDEVGKLLWSIRQIRLANETSPLLALEARIIGGALKPSDDGKCKGRAVEIAHHLAAYESDALKLRSHNQHETIFARIAVALEENNRLLKIALDRSNTLGESIGALKDLAKAVEQS